MFRALARSLVAYKPGVEVSDMAALMFTISKNEPGALNSVLQCFLNHNLNMTHIESKPASSLDVSQGFTFIVDVEKPESNVLAVAMEEMKDLCSDVTLLGSLEVPWFPRKLDDLDTLPQAIRPLPTGHPGSSDQAYIERRQMLQQKAMSVKINDAIPRFEYDDQENKVWKTLYVALSPLLLKRASDDYLLIFKEMEEKKLIQEGEVPQIADLQAFLRSKTGWYLKPIANLSSQRDFLNALAFRVFPTTVHMRHPSHPYFSIDPDVAHEVLGHVPMLANTEFAEFVQQIGLASLGASDEDIQKLINLYFYSVEHGLELSSLGERRVYGARLLSSVDEIYHALSIKPELRFFDPFQACKFKYTRSGLQPVYWFSSDFREAKILIERFAASLARPFYVVYDRQGQVIKVDHKVKGVR